MFRISGKEEMMTENSELAAWLEELETEHAAKALVIASIRQRLGLEPSEGAATPAVPIPGTSRSTAAVQHQGPIRADTFFGLSIPEAIKKYLAIMKRPQSPRAITDGLQQGGVLTQASNFYVSVQTALKRLRDAGVIVLTKEGWGMAAWYPNRKVELPKVTTKKKRKKHAASKSGSKSSAAKGKTGWHDFLAAALKDGKTMKNAAAEWKLRRAESA